MTLLRTIGRHFLGMPPMVQAAALMIFGAFCVASQNAMIRVASADIHTFEIVFFRNLFGLLVMVPLLIPRGNGLLRISQPGGLLLMSLCHLAGMVCYFLALAYLPLADVIALSFSKPLFVTLGAALILAEVVKARRWSAVLLGFLGVLIVLQPGVDVVSPYALIVIAGTVMAAATALMIKRLTVREAVASIVWYQGLFATAFSLPLCLLHWRMPDMMEWSLLIAIGALGTLSWLSQTRALFLIDASAAAPFEFLRLPFAALIAYLMFTEVPKLTTWLGGILIFGAAVYIARREAAAGRRVDD